MPPGPLGADDPFVQVEDPSSVSLPAGNFLQQRDDRSSQDHQGSVPGPRVVACLLSCLRMGAE